MIEFDFGVLIGVALKVVVVLVIGVVIVVMFDGDDVRQITM